MATDILINKIRMLLVKSRKSAYFQSHKKSIEFDLDLKLKMRETPKNL